MIDAITALRYLSKAVDEKGENYVDPNSAGGPYSGCQYFQVLDFSSYNEVTDEYEDRLPITNHMEPCCIVGHVISYRWDGENVISTVAELHNDTGVDALVNDVPTLFTELATEVLLRAQSVQDKAGTWGKAYTAAVDYLGLHYEVLTESPEIELHDEVDES